LLPDRPTPRVERYNQMLWILDLVKAATYPPS
jgi:hypothetical protein